MSNKDEELKKSLATLREGFTNQDGKEKKQKKSADSTGTISLFFNEESSVRCTYDATAFKFTFQLLSCVIQNSVSYAHYTYQSHILALH